MRTITEKLKYVVGLLILWAVVFFFIWIGAAIDLAFNPWVSELELDWWNFFTTHHYLAWVLSQNYATGLILISIFSGLSVPLYFLYSYLDS